MKNKKYLVKCKCGRIILKTNDDFIKTFIAQTKCPDCKKILKIPNDVVITLDKHSVDKVK